MSFFKISQATTIVICVTNGLLTVFQVLGQVSDDSICSLFGVVSV